MRITFCMALYLFCKWALSQGPVDGFMKGKGNCIVALVNTMETYDQIYLGNTQTDFGEYKTTSQSFYAVGGLNDKLDLYLNIPFISAEFGGSSTCDLQDISVYLKYLVLSTELCKGRLDFMPILGAAAPLSDYDPTQLIGIGKHAKTLEARAILQYRLSNFFLCTQYAYKHKESPAINDIHVVVKSGYAHEKIYFDLFVDITHAQGGYDIGDNNYTFENIGVSSTKFGATVYYPILNNTFGVFACASTTYCGRNVGKNDRISLGVILHPISLLSKIPNK